MVTAAVLTAQLAEQLETLGAEWEDSGRPWLEGGDDSENGILFLLGLHAMFLVRLPFDTSSSVRVIYGIIFFIR